MFLFLFEFSSGFSLIVFFSLCDTYGYGFLLPIRSYSFRSVLFLRTFSVLFLLSFPLSFSVPSFPTVRRTRFAFIAGLGSLSVGGLGGGVFSLGTKNGDWFMTFNANPYTHYPPVFSLGSSFLLVSYGDWLGYTGELVYIKERQKERERFLSGFETFVIKNWD